MIIDDKSGMLRDAKKKGFDEFMNLPTTRALISVLPPSEHPDLLVTLLESAFNHGTSTGMATILLDLFETMKDRKPR